MGVGVWGGVWSTVLLACSQRVLTFKFEYFNVFFHFLGIICNLNVAAKNWELPINQAGFPIFQKEIPTQGFELQLELFALHLRSVVHNILELEEHLIR